MNYQLARHVDIVKQNGEIFLLSKTPLCLLKINHSLADLITRDNEAASVDLTDSETAVLEQLVSKGFMKRLKCSSYQPEIWPEISIVIPVKDRADELKRCLSSLSRLTYPQDKLEVIVVDDGSSDSSPQVAHEFGASVVPSGGKGRGPAAARNVGASRAHGEILAFIDSDCLASPGWLNELIPAFNNPEIVAVGGQVDGMCSDSAVDRYEAVMSSLSLGSRERIGSSGTDTFYLPSCNLLVRTRAFRSVGGFKDEMHVGEDVDLTWRLRDIGGTICYLPAGNIQHEHRSTVKSFMSRRFDYGTSEGMLQKLHPERKKQMVIPPLLGLLLLLFISLPIVGWWSLLPIVSVLLIDAIVINRKMSVRTISVSLVSILGGRLRALGSLVYYLSFHLVRYYSLILILCSLLVPVVSLLFLAILGCSAAIDYMLKKPKQSFVEFVIIYALEHISYGSGVFWGCFRTRCFSSYRVALLRHSEVPA